MAAEDDQPNEHIVFGAPISISMATIVNSILEKEAVATLVREGSWEEFQKQAHARLIAPRSFKRGWEEYEREILELSRSPYWMRKRSRLRLERLALLVMTLEQADERLGDLDEQCKIVQSRHSIGYARLWYWWTGFWIVARAVRGKAAANRLLDALISWIGKS